MTIREFYEWAIANGLENATMVFTDDNWGDKIKCRFKSFNYNEKDNTIIINDD
jgi:hypothetical protein